MSLKNNNNKNKINHLLDVESDDEKGIVSWESEDDQNTEKSDSEEESIDEDDEIISLEDIQRGLSSKKKKEKNQEINFEVIKDDKKNKCVKISINLDLEETDNIINLEFSISKEIFLKIAKELK
jgi:hypothetical protein